MSCFLTVWAPKELSYFTGVVSGILGLIATVGNGLVVFATIKDPLKNLQTPFNYFLVSLAISDLIIGLVSMPISVVLHLQEVKGWLDLDLVKTLHVIYFISQNVSLCNLIALSVDRYIAICKAHKYHIYFNSKRFKLITLLIWLVAVILSQIYFISDYITTLFISIFSSVMIGLIVLLVVYTKLVKFLNAQAKRMKEQTNNSKDVETKNLQRKSSVTKVLFLIIIVYVVTNITASIMIITLQFCVSCNCIFRHSLRDLQFLLIVTNSCVNPFICTMRLKTYKKAIKKLFCKEETELESVSYTARVRPSNQ